uniref:Glycogenin 2 n=1 Tax=Cercocebus atys TaxID=9531 RepID=A0A2K5MT54_CERAT
MTDQAFVTLTTNDAYTKGALVLDSSLKQHRTTRRLVMLPTPQRVFDEVIMVDVLDSGDSAHLSLMKRSQLSVMLTKLHCWSLTYYSKCVFMDADTLVPANIDDLFEREELSAPSIETYNQLLHLASEQGSFDGGEQSIQNTFFNSWATTDIRKHLLFIYSLSYISIYSYLPAFKVFGGSAKVVHFLGRGKPWNYDPKTKSVNFSSWWNIFTTIILPLLQQFGNCSYINVEDVSGAISHLSRGDPRYGPAFVSSEEWKEQWEQGQADYMGADSFGNMERKLDTYLQ